eukprot:GCRY01002664.1.p1 GENE.GCRY01002664.1~~GCRY01002664.1.p1  ORF type:complete len:338 (+),score=51.25 GCRY01002664.1:267-1280(+)
MNITFDVCGVCARSDCICANTMRNDKWETAPVMSDPKDVYVCEEVVGEGAFGTVYKGYNRITNEIVAIKVVNLEETSQSVMQLQGEMDFWANLSSPQIARYITSFVNNGTELWIVMEYVSGGSALELLQSGPLKEEHVATILHQVLKALAYLHKELMVHRDIKGDNILISDDGDVKLIDFSISTRLNNENGDKMELAGSLFWMAPEVVDSSSLVSHKSDLWSLGITAIELTKGHPPYESEDPAKVIKNIVEKDPPVLTGNYSSTFKDFVSKCLVKDPKKRASADDLLKHKFIKKGKKGNSCLTPLVQKWRESGGRKKVTKKPLEPKQDPLEEITWIF